MRIDDYQTRQAYRALVRDHYAILKASRPGVNFASAARSHFALAQMGKRADPPGTT